jgi:hypothetical protein
MRGSDLPTFRPPDVLSTRARVAEWQTQWTQNPPRATSCEFDSRLGHYVTQRLTESPADEAGLWYDQTIPDARPPACGRPGAVRRFEGALRFAQPL